MTVVMKTNLFGEEYAENLGILLVPLQFMAIKKEGRVIKSENYFLMAVKEYLRTIYYLYPLILHLKEYICYNYQFHLA